MKIVGVDDRLLIFLDTETTGLREYDKIIQLAYMYEGKSVNEYFNPKRKISKDASEVNHITDDMLKDKPEFKHSIAAARLKTLIDMHGGVVVAHNADFDIKMLAKEGLEVKDYIDTMKLAMDIKKRGIEKYPAVNLQALIDYYDIKLSDDVVAHDAYGDVIRLKCVFNMMRRQYSSIDEMVEVSRS